MRTSVNFACAGSDDDARNTSPSASDGALLAGSAFGFGEFLNRSLTGGIRQGSCRLHSFSRCAFG
jgi:hypothetical protein